MIEVHGVVKKYGKKQNIFTALDGVDLEIAEGSTVAIIGKSGSGKSTLMHVMSGLDHPTTGTVKVNGTDLSSMKQKALDAFRAKSMSFIFQAFFVEGNQTCYQNVMLPLEIAKVGQRNRRARVLEALEAVDLAEKIDVKARNLSGGQRQRLAIARSIVNKPNLIFADEPTGNLDSVTGERIIKLLFDLNKNMGSTLIIVTHDDELAARCQTQVQLKDGKIVAITSNKKSARPKQTKTRRAA
jgi:putative ABC transport system ATP-binding protein